MSTPARDHKREHLTIRDEFAKVALIGVLSGDNFISCYPETVATWAYDYADAMLKVKEKTDAKD